jgi:hypothetical protein
MTTTVRLTETQWQQRVMDAAKLHGWLVVHIRAVETAKGRWSVPYEGDTGLPDLILLRDGVTLLRELKTDTGRVSATQLPWIEHGAKVWRPADWPDVLRELRGDDHHRFTPADDGIRCLHCGLPRGNRRHRTLKGVTDGLVQGG